MLSGALVAWSFAASRLHEIDAILSTSPNRDEVPLWLARAMSYRRQLVLPLFGAVTAPLYLLIVSRSVSATVSVAFPSYLMAAWMGFVGGSVLYWIWVTPTMAKLLHTSTNLTLRWHDPASTPGLRLLADGYSIAAVFLLAGVLALAGFAFVPAPILHNPRASVLLLALFAVAVATSVRLALVPFYWIWSTANRHKRRAMALIASRVPALDMATDGQRQDAEYWLRLYQYVARTPALPFNTAATVQYGAALAGAVVAFLIGLLTRAA